LVCVHSLGYVHCDVQPENLLLDREFDVKLIDFKTAKRGATWRDKWFGRRNKIQGTRRYMSPEQIRGQYLDARSDIYSLGCTVFELVTGQVPFDGNTPNEVLSQHLRASRPDVAELNDQVTREFSELVKALMAIHRDDRPKSIDNVLDLVRSTAIYRS
jgi:eukaryotic-like serine/threonine-protein kinase